MSVRCFNSFQSLPNVRIFCQLKQLTSEISLIPHCKIYKNINIPLTKKKNENPNKGVRVIERGWNIRHSHYKLLNFEGNIAKATPVRR